MGQPRLWTSPKVKSGHKNFLNNMQKMEEGKMAAVRLMEEFCGSHYNMVKQSLAMAS